MTEPWELNDPVPENHHDRTRQRRKQAGITLVALLVVVGLIGTTMMGMF